MSESGGQICAIDGRIVEIPLVDPIGVKNVYFEKTYFALFRLTDEDGTSGYSGLWCFRPDLPDLFVTVTEFMAQGVVGRGLDRTGEISEVLEATSGFIGRTGLAVFGISAIRMAIEDLVCRRLNVSLAQLLGKVRTHVQPYKTGLFLSLSMDELVKGAQQANAEGFRALKMWVGSDDLEEDLERIRAVREAVEPGTKIMIDASQAWNLPQAYRALDPIAELDPVWLEDPLPYGDVGGLRSLVKRSPIPIATGENHYLPDSFRELFDCGVQYVEPDLQRLGGIREWVQLTAMASLAGAVVVPHCYASVALQLCAATHQSENWIEYVPWWQTIFADELAIVDGMIEVPSTVGIGFELDHDVVDNLARSDWRTLAKVG